MPAPFELTDELWSLVEDLFDPPGRRGPPVVIPRRQMVEATLYVARTGWLWRYLPERYGRWNSVWPQFWWWRRSGVWAAAMDCLRRELRVQAGRDPEPSLVTLDCQVTKGGRGGPSFHENHGKYRLCAALKVIAIDYLGLPVGAAVFGARRHDVGAARELLDELLPRHPRVAAVLGDRVGAGRRDRVDAVHDVSSRGRRAVVRGPTFYGPSDG